MTDLARAERVADLLIELREIDIGATGIRLIDDAIREAEAAARADAVANLAELLVSHASGKLSSLQLIAAIRARARPEQQEAAE